MIDCFEIRKLKDNQLDLLFQSGPVASAQEKGWVNEASSKDILLEEGEEADGASNYQGPAKSKYNWLLGQRRI